MKIAVAILISLIFIVKQTIACTCENPDTKEYFEKEWKSVEFVIEIIVIEELDESEGNIFYGKRIFRAKILNVYKGEIETKKIDLYTVNDGGGECNFYYEIDKSYLFYGWKGLEDNYYHTSICNRTGELQNKSFDLELINKYK